MFFLVYRDTQENTFLDSEHNILFKKRILQSTILQNRLIGS